MLINNFSENKINSEQWKYTNFKLFKNSGIYTPNKSQISLSKTDGIYIKNNEFSISDNIDQKISVSHLDNINNNNCLSTIQDISNGDINPFIEMNKKNYSNGIYLQIQNNAHLTNPIEIKYDIDENKLNSFYNNRLFISIGKNVSGQIIINEEFPFIGCLNTFVEVFVDQNSSVDIIVLSNKKKTTQVYNFSSTISKNSTLNLFPIDIYGKFIKKNYFIFLKGENSSINYNSLNLLGDLNHIDNFIKINHQNSYTNSNTFHKNILKGNSKSVFYTKAVINKEGIHSEATQKNNNLMLSNRAVVHSNPQLEIYNNDVKCAHGSTTGQMNEEILFYMQTRGLEKEDCKKIILQGFSDEILYKLKNDKLQNHIQNKINNWINHVN